MAREYADGDALTEIEPVGHTPRRTVARRRVRRWTSMASVRRAVEVDAHREARAGAGSDERDPLPGAVGLLFGIGAVGVLVRRNAIVVFMCVELMLNAVNLSLVSFARMHGNLDGVVMAFFVMVVAAAEVVVGLAIIMSIFRSRRSASVDDANLLKF